MAAPLTAAYIAIGASHVLRGTAADDARRSRLYRRCDGELGVVDYILIHADTVDTIDGEDAHPYAVASAYGGGCGPRAARRPQRQSRRRR